MRGRWWKRTRAAVCLESERSAETFQQTLLSIVGLIATSSIYFYMLCSLSSLFNTKQCATLGKCVKAKPVVQLCRQPQAMRTVITARRREFWTCTTSSTNLNVSRTTKRRMSGFSGQNTTTLHTPPSLVRSEAQRKTIYALSTPPGKAGVAVIRVSGAEALQVWTDFVCIRSKKEKSKEILPEPWKMYRCDVLHPQTRELLDSGLAVFFKGTHYHDYL